MHWRWSTFLVPKLENIYREQINKCIFLQIWQISSIQTKTHFSVEKLENVHVEYSSATFIARVNLHLVIQWKGFCKSTRNFFIIVKHPLRPFKTSSNVLRCKYSRFGAVLYYTSCWDCVGMKFDIVGIDPNCRHPKPRPTTSGFI